MPTIFMLRVGELGEALSHKGALVLGTLYPFGVLLDLEEATRIEGFDSASHPSQDRQWYGHLTLV